MDELKKLLRENHIQVTQQRLEVLKVLRELNCHVTVEDVVNALNAKDITLTLASVYNILGIFEKKGLIMKIGAAGEPVIFDCNTFPHFHIVDSETRAVTDLIDDELMGLISGYMEEHPVGGIAVDRIDLNLIGHSEASDM